MTLQARPRCGRTIERLAAFPDSPIYHYGSYDKKAFATLAKRHSIGGGIGDRLVNVAPLYTARSTSRSARTG